MAHSNHPQNPKRRRGAIVVLTALMLVALLTMVAFAIDIGYIGLVRTQLQAAADSAALAAAGVTNNANEDMLKVAHDFAEAHDIGGRKAQLLDSDVQYGSWDVNSRTFTPSSTPGNAVKVTVRMDATAGGETALFFGRLFGAASVSQQASAVATVNPRDICFVVDLSGTMNNDTEPAYTASLNSEFAAEGYPTVGSDQINKVYADFGYDCTYGSEVSQYIGQGLSGVSKKSSFSTTFSQLTSTSGPLSKSTISDPYRIYRTDSTSTRTYKAYRWIIDNQIPSIMPAATPTPDSANSANYYYWKYFIDQYWSALGYRNYLQMMMDYGRDQKVSSSGLYVPLSLASSDCPMHSEETAGGTFDFPPREQPTHAGRRAIIAAIQLIKERNQSIIDVNQRDWISILSFDKSTDGATPTIVKSLDSDYDAAMQACTTLQACGDSGYSTATETGILTAYNHVKPISEGGQGRLATNKIVVLLTDGKPNLKTSSNTAIANYIRDNPNSNFYNSSSYYSYDAALMQTAIMQGKNWYLYPVGIGLDCDYTFMDRLARMGVTANTDGESPRGSGNPSEYEAVLTEIFEKIITNPKLHLVQ